MGRSAQIGSRGATRPQSTDRSIDPIQIVREMTVALAAGTKVAQIRATSLRRGIFMHSSETETTSTQLDPTSAASTIEPPVPQSTGSLPDTVPKLAIWQRLRSQPRETAAVVVLVVTAIIWLDSGSKQSDTSIPADPLDEYDSILSQFETSEDFDSLPVSSEPFDSTSRDSFGGGELVIPNSQQSGFTNTVTADYGDSSAKFGHPSAGFSGHAATDAGDPDDLATYDSSAIRSNSSRPSVAPNGSSANPSRRIRFAGRIKPAN